MILQQNPRRVMFDMSISHDQLQDDVQQGIPTSYEKFERSYKEIKSCKIRGR